MERYDVTLDGVTLLANCCRVKSVPMSQGIESNPHALTTTRF